MAGSQNSRAARRAVLALALALALLVAGAAPARAEAASPFFGVAAETEPEELEGMGDAGVGTLATLFHWRLVQLGGPTVFNWTDTDELVAAAAREDIELLPVLFGNALWLGESREPPLDTKEARDGWRGFVEAAVERYGPDGEFWSLNPDVPKRPIRTWQAWQEVNIDFFFLPDTSAPRYAQLLEITADAIRSVDPGATIVLGGLVDIPTRSERNVPLARYLKRLYKIKGTKANFDVLSLHAYGARNKEVREQLERARRQMRKAKDKRTPIWVTEIGWSSERANHRLMVGPKKQASRLRKAFRMLRKQRRKYRIERVLWFTWRDYAEQHCRWCNTAGLHEIDGRPKPALAEFKRFARD